MVCQTDPTIVDFGEGWFYGRSHNQKAWYNISSKTRDLGRLLGHLKMSQNVVLRLVSYRDHNGRHFENIMDG